MTKAASQDNNQALGDLVAEGLVVPAGGRDVRVRPLTPRKLPAALAALEPLQAGIGAGLDLEHLDAAALGQLAMRHAEDVVQFVAAATGESPDFIGDEINAAELIELFAAVVQVNAGFFAHRVVPALLRTAQQMASLKPAGRA